MQTTTVRIDRRTHERLRRLAQETGQTITETLAEAVRQLRQQRMGDDLARYTPTPEDEQWLDADAVG